MKLYVYSVMDQAVGSFMQPFFCRSQPEALRMMKEACLDPNHIFHRHGHDYRLYYLGLFDDSTGLMEPRESPSFVIGADVIVAQAAQASPELPLFSDRQKPNGRGPAASLAEGAPDAS